MADFGEDVGQSALGTSKSIISTILHEQIRNYLHDRKSADAIAKLNEGKMQYLSFDNMEDANKLAKTLSDTGIKVNLYESPNGKALLALPENALIALREQFSQLNKTLWRPVELTQEEASKLTKVKLPESKTNKQDKSAPQKEEVDEKASKETDRAEDPRNHTQEMADKVKATRDKTSSYEEFVHALAEEEIGVTETAAGELMFFKSAKTPDGTLLPYEHGRDWAVGAATLKEKWNVDATHKWFETQEVADGALDTDAATPALDQGVKSHDSMDTDERTVRIEREQNGTDIPPSKVQREQRGIDELRKEKTALSETLNKSGQEIEKDISNMFQPSL